MLLTSLVLILAPGKLVDILARESQLVCPDLVSVVERVSLWMYTLGLQSCRRQQVGLMIPRPDGDYTDMYPSSSAGHTVLYLECMSDGCSSIY